MKKLFALLLVVVMLLSLAACGGKKKPTGMEPSKATVKPATAEEIAAAEAEIRSAIGLLLDRNYIVEFVSQAGEVPAGSFVAMGMADAKDEFYMNAGDNEGYYGYYDVAKTAFDANFKKAISILKKYYDFDGQKFIGFPTLNYIYNTSDSHKAIAEYIQGALAQVGINMTLQNQEWDTFLNTRKDGDYSVARNGWVADYTDPICFLDMWITASGNNDIQFGRGAHADLKIYNLDLTQYGLDIKVTNGTWAQTYDVLIGEIKKCTNPDNRYAMMHIAEDMLMATGCITPIYYYTDIYMLNPGVEGFYSNPLGYKYFHKTTFNGKGDSLAVCLASEPENLDPALNSAVDGATMLAQLFAGLAKWDQVDGKLTVVADCAKELVEGVVNSDGTVTYTYTLKDGLKWSDGKALTAHDFEFAWKRAASNALGADYGYMFDVIKGFGTEAATDTTAVNLAVKALSDTQLQVTLNNSITYWNELLAFPTYFPVRSDVVSNENWASEANTYVCNGAYTISAWTHDSVITLTKNANYHDAGIVTMNEVKFYLSDDANNMLVNYKNGTWQLIDDVPTNEIPDLKKNYKDEFVVAGQIGTYYVCWNVNESLLPKN